MRPASRGRVRRNAIPLLLVLAALACSSDLAGPGLAPRSYLMGFSAFPPNFSSTALVLQVIDTWAPRADAALMHQDVPWAAMLGGISAAAEVRGNELNLVNYYRGKGLALVFTIDVTNGLDRSQEAPALVAAGRSISDSMIQRLYGEYVSAVDSILHPAYLGLAAETNLIRVAAPAPIYDALVLMTNAAAAERRLAGTTAKLYVSVQAEVAWGRLQGAPAYVGIAQDRADFPFIDALGISSYPYLAGFLQPEDLPLDYYARIAGSTPVLVVEGGWASASTAASTSSPALQARYLRRQPLLLDSARAVGVFQIDFTDLELSAFPQPYPANLPLFISLGLVDTTLAPKPALAVWDSTFARPR